ASAEAKKRVDGLRTGGSELRRVASNNLHEPGLLRVAETRDVLDVDDLFERIHSCQLGALNDHLVGRARRRNRRLDARDRELAKLGCFGRAYRKMQRAEHL